MHDARLIAVDGSADLSIEGADLLEEDSLSTAVLLSLFCDAYAEDRPELDDRRGWWADSDEDRFGSQLWLVRREKTSTETAERARRYAENALAWLVELDVVESVSVATRYVRRGFLQLDVTLRRGAARAWSIAWEAFLGLEYRFEGIALVARAA